MSKRVSQHMMYITRQLEADNTQTLLLRSGHCPGQCSGPLPASFERCLRRQHVTFSAQRIQEWTVQTLLLWTGWGWHAHAHSQQLRQHAQLTEVKPAWRSRRRRGSRCRCKVWHLRRRSRRHLWSTCHSHSYISPRRHSSAVQESTNGALQKMSQSQSFFTWGEWSSAQAAQSSSGSSTCRIPCTHDLGTAMQASPHQCYASIVISVPCKHRHTSAMQTSSYQCHANIAVSVPLCLDDNTPAPGQLPAWGQQPAAWGLQSADEDPWR